MTGRIRLLTCALALCLTAIPAFARGAPEPGATDRRARMPGEQMYSHLSALARGGADGAATLERVRAAAAAVRWDPAKVLTVDGNLRRLEVEGAAPFYFVRTVDGDVFVLAMPADAGALAKGSGTPYADLDSHVGTKERFSILEAAGEVDGVRYRFVKLTAPPARLLLDRLFFIAIVALLFLTMVGMGLTLTMGDFAIVFRKPLGMIVGPICTFGVMPVLAMGLAHAFGFYDAYPFIFVGFILISASPGGVTSNLMTYFGKGDVALSVSLTAVCTVLALFFTPLLLKVYAPNIPDFSVPAGEIFKTMLVLVVVPLAVGMLIRWKAERFAKRAEKVFAAIGILALLFLIIVGILGNLDKFGDTDRYGFAFYAGVFVLTFAGMIVSGVVAKVVRIRNYQVRAISLETGLRNASLAMTIALLIQDRMGDFYSSMFFTSGIFGLWMYVAGVLTILLFPRILPVSEEELRLHREKGKQGVSEPAAS